ncbi:hypothetical protein LX36DRAFT_472025 [Colletotrichum falcatum]|nr:hypothetical protein LX36DRAFT_472025 [Colletotrichum falcatum]
MQLSMLEALSTEMVESILEAVPLSEDTLVRLHDTSTLLRELVVAMLGRESYWKRKLTSREAVPYSSTVQFYLRNDPRRLGTVVCTEPVLFVHPKVAVLVREHVQAKGLVCPLKIFDFVGGTGCCSRCVVSGVSGFCCSVARWESDCEACREVREVRVGARMRTEYWFFRSKPALSGLEHCAECGASVAEVKTRFHHLLSGEEPAVRSCLCGTELVVDAVRQTLRSHASECCVDVERRPVET